MNSHFTAPKISIHFKIKCTTGPNQNIRPINLWAIGTKRAGDVNWAKFKAVTPSDWLELSAGTIFHLIG